jgi:hypothetical protein
MRLLNVLAACPRVNACELAHNVALLICNCRVDAIRAIKGQGAYYIFTVTRHP